MIVGITGNIASGKSSAATFLRQAYGVFVINADEVGHDILESNLKVKQSLINSFGVQILNDEGAISRKKLGQMVFNDSAAMDFLNDTISPYLLFEVDELLQRAKKVYQIIVLDSALILEWNARNRVQVLVTVYADDELRVWRLMQERRLDEIDARLRIAAQMSQEEKIKQSDYQIPNNGAMAELREQTFLVWEKVVGQNRAAVPQDL